VAQGPAESGVLRTIGRLGMKVSGQVGFDIAGDGRAYAALKPSGSRSVSLMRIDLSSGRARPTSEVDAISAFRGRRIDPVRALAAAGRVRDDTQRPRVRNRKLNDPRVSELLSGRVLRLEVRCSEACVIETQLLYRTNVVGGATGAILGGGGRVVLPLKLTPKGRRVVRRLRPNRLQTAIRVSDMAGNSVQTSGFRR
jgi:hypothetical protein